MLKYVKKKGGVAFLKSVDLLVIREEKKEVFMERYTYPKFLSLIDKNCTSASGTLYKITRDALASVLAISGAAKLVDASGLLATLQQLPFLSEGLSIWAATLLPLLELGLAAALFLQWKPPLILGATGLLFVVFLSFAIYGVYMNMAGDCGCFGPLVKSSFGWDMILRNGIFLSLSVAVLVAYNKQNLREQG